MTYEITENDATSETAVFLLIAKRAIDDIIQADLDKKRKKNGLVGNFKAFSSS